MAFQVVRVEQCHDDPLDAAEKFYAEYLERRVEAGVDLVVYRFGSAGHEHRGWRLAAIQNLARRFAPVRVNGIVGNQTAAYEEALAYLQGAPGITGQLLELAGD
jgi:hypothetical protein